MKKDKVNELIEKSGNNFHYQVVNFLRNKDWFVSISPYYNDNMTGKPREIDIVAEKEFDVKKEFGRFKGTLNVKLFIECKYINKPTVFWFDKRDKEKAIKRIVRDTPLKLPNQNNWINEHHYLEGDKVAKLFASYLDKAQDNEPIYKALSQSLNAMVYYRSNHSIIPDEKLKGNTLKNLKYPLIICNSFKNFFEINSTDSRGYSEVNDNFQLEINYAYLDNDKHTITDYFLIDIIGFEDKKFDAFLEKLEQADIKMIRSMLYSM